MVSGVGRMRIWVTCECRHAQTRDVKCDRDKSFYISQLGFCDECGADLAYQVLVEEQRRRREIPNPYSGTEDEP